MNEHRNEPHETVETPSKDKHFDCIGQVSENTKLLIVSGNHGEDKPESTSTELIIECAQRATGVLALKVQYQGREYHLKSRKLSLRSSYLEIRGYVTGYLDLLYYAKGWI